MAAINSNIIQKIENFISNLLKENEDIFLVDLKITNTNDIRIFLDGDKGITIEKCVRINRALYKQIEENNLFTNSDFSLEVSSPGIEEPLKQKRQFIKNIGRTVEVTMNDEVKIIGKLMAAGGDEIVIEEKQGANKKIVIKSTNISFNQIKHVKVLVTF